jgi:hypothetical protein
MITIGIKKGETVTNYNIPTNFDEWTWAQYVKYITVYENNIIQKVTTITNIPEDDLINFDIEDLGKLLNTLHYADIPYVAESYGGINIDLNIGKESYGKLEAARQAIIQSGNWVKAAQKVGMVYLDEDISEYQLPLAMAKIKTVFELLNEFLTKFKKLYEGEVEAEEEMAGVEVFRRFGSFPTIDRLAITYGITHDEVLEMPAEIVMTKLLYDLEKAEYDERLMKIKTTK